MAKKKNIPNDLIPRELLLQTWTGYQTERSLDPHLPEYMILYPDGTFDIRDEGPSYERDHRHGRWTASDGHVSLFSPDGIENKGFLQRLDREWLQISFYGMNYYLSLLDPKKDFFRDRESG